MLIAVDGHSHILQRELWSQDDIKILLIEERTTAGYTHALTFSDVRVLLASIPQADLRGLKAILLHQPTRKEEQRHPRWAAYSPEFSRREVRGPTIFLEAIDATKALRWSHALEPEDERELALLEQEGHAVQRERRAIVISMESSAVGRTQRRSFFHELGHHVDYMRDPLGFAHKTRLEKESVANRYARQQDN